MNLAIMQPYFLPYIGYFQLIAAADKFVVYDNIKYTKKGWINRNRMLVNGSDAIFSLPLTKDSDTLHVVQRGLAVEFNRGKLLNKFKGAYDNAPFFEQTFPLLKRIICFEENNLFRYIHHSIVELCAYLGIMTPIFVSSEIQINHDLKGQDKVIAICQKLEADTYINAIGGIEIYHSSAFQNKNIKLKFLKAQPYEYAQFGSPFVPWLSIIDVLMFNSHDEVKQLISYGYDLI